MAELYGRSGVDWMFTGDYHTLYIVISTRLCLSLITILAYNSDLPFVQVVRGWAHWLIKVKVITTRAVQQEQLEEGEGQCRLVPRLLLIPLPELLGTLQLQMEPRECVTVAYMYMYIMYM